MTTSAVSANATSASSMNSPDVMSGTKSTLNQTDFLKLLVAQIQYQDPLNPQSDTQMAAQMAQFSSLQSATATSSSLAMLQANSLVGSTVSLQVDSTTTAKGVVSGVVMSNGAPEITVGGTNYKLSQITAITPPATTSTQQTTQTTQ